MMTLVVEGLFGNFKLAKSAQELKWLLEKERKQKLRKAKNDDALRVARKRYNQKLDILEHRIANPNSILNHNEFISEFCEILDSYTFSSGALTASEKKLVSASQNFGNAAKYNFKTREKLLNIARKVVAENR